MLVCILLDIKSAVILFFSVSLSFFLYRSTYLGNGDSDRREFLHNGTAIIRTHLLPFGGNIFRGHQMQGQERGAGGPFWPLGHLTANISKMVSWSVNLCFNQSLTSAQRELSKNVRHARGATPRGVHCKQNVLHF